METSRQYRIEATRRENLLIPRRLRRVEAWIVADASGLAALTCPGFGQTRRTPDLELSGPLGEGRVLSRPSSMRFELSGPEGTTRIDGRWGRPTRGFRPGWEVQTRGGQAMRLTRDHAVSRPGRSSTYSTGDDLIVRVGSGPSATVDVGSGLSAEEDEALVAALVCLVMDPKPDID